MIVDPKWFGGRLRELREAKGLSRKELAERAGMRSEAGVRDIEQGRRLPVWDTVVALCAVLGVDAAAFQSQPAERETDKGGRPAKPVEEPPPAPAEPKPRGRPRKGEATGGAEKKTAQRGKGKRSGKG